MSGPSKFVISLDFEFAWGTDVDSCGTNRQAQLLGTRKAIPRMLELFEARRVRATWATVGILFFDIPALCSPA